MGMIGHLKNSYSRDDIFIGYAYLPEGVNREDYVTECKKYSKVSVILANGGAIHNVTVPVHLIKYICKNIPENPLSSNEKDGVNMDCLGACVLMATVPLFNGHAVIGVYPKSSDLNLEEEGTDIVQNTYINNTSIINNYANSGGTGLDFDTFSDFDRDGNIRFTAENTSGNAAIQFDSNLFGASSSKKILLKTQDDKEGIKSAVSLNEKEVGIWAHDKISLGFDELEPAVLGNTLVELLSDLIDAISNITVPTAFGPSGKPLNEIQFTGQGGLKERLEDMLSNLVYIGNRGTENFEYYEIDALVKAQDGSAVTGTGTTENRTEEEIIESLSQINRDIYEKIIDKFEFPKTIPGAFETITIGGKTVTTDFAKTGENENGYKLKMTSSYRTRMYEEQIDKNGNKVQVPVRSQHPYGEAFDIYVIDSSGNKSEEKTWEIFDYIYKELDFNQILMEYNEEPDYAFRCLHVSRRLNNQNNRKGYGLLFYKTSTSKKSSRSAINYPNTPGNSKHEIKSPINNKLVLSGSKK
jgi:hypothetical protein